MIMQLEILCPCAMRKDKGNGIGIDESSCVQPDCMDISFPKDEKFYIALYITLWKSFQELKEGEGWELKKCLILTSGYLEVGER